MPISPTQQRNLEILVAQDLSVLDVQLQEALVNQVREEKQQILDSWKPSNPQVEDVVKKIKRYDKVVTKKMQEYIDELVAAGVRRETLPNVESWIFVYQFAGLLAPKKDPEVVRALQKADEQHYARQRAVQVAVAEIRREKNRQILVATLEGDGVDVLTMPSVEEILEGLK
jgi:hypothetical protein